jgi:hypothetical protein
MIFGILSGRKNLDDLKHLMSFGSNSDLYKCYPKAARYYGVFLYANLLGIIDAIYSNQSPDSKVFLNIPEEMNDIYRDLHDAMMSVFLRKDISEFNHLTHLPHTLHTDQAGECSSWHTLKESYLDQLKEIMIPFHGDIKTRYYDLPLDIEAHLNRMNELLLEFSKIIPAKSESNNFKWENGKFEYLGKTLLFNSNSNSLFIFDRLLVNRNKQVSVKMLSERLGIPPKDVRRIMKELNDRLKGKSLYPSIAINSSREGSYSMIFQ